VGVRPGAIPALALLAALAVAVPARAQEVNGYVELAAGKDRTETAIGGQNVSRDDETFTQRYSLDLLFRPYPNLQVIGGGLFERTDSTTHEDDLDIDGMQRRIRPYLTATLRNAIYNAAFGYFRTRDDLKSGPLSLGNIQESWNATFGWRPDGFPRVTGRFIRTNNFDPDKSLVDTTSDLADLVGEYQPVDALQLYYRGAVETFDDHLQDITVDRTTQSGRVTYGDTFFDRRLEVNGEYDANHFTTDVTTSGVGLVTTTLFPVTGLRTDPNPVATPTLIVDTTLSDQNTAAATVVDLGLPAVPPTRPIDIGLDLDVPKGVNLLTVWIDRDLPLPIANSFSWDVYTSPDNLNWSFRQTVFPASFGALDRRFEIAFATQTTRFIKVVTQPLAASIPGSAGFPDIFVTEIVAALRQPAADIRGSSAFTTDLLTTNLRARILRDHPELDYELSYFRRDSTASESTWTLSNGLSLRHVFNPVYSVAGRVAREDGRELQGDRVTYLYTASLRAVPLPTLSSSVIASGRDSTIEGRSSDSSSLYWYTSADVYRGINTSLGLGKASVTGEDRTQTDTTQINALATLVPHPTTTLNLLYQATNGTQHGGVLAGTRSLDTTATQAGVAYRPFATLYLFYSYRLEDAAGTAQRHLWSATASWAPFPDGTLQVLISADESYQSGLDALSRIWSPRVRWNITPRWYAEVGMQRSRFTSTSEDTRTDSLTATSRIWF
jgi:hypothetical protein